MSKAIIIAGGVLIAVGLISLVMIMYQSYREYNDLVADSEISKEVAEWNRYYTQCLYDVDRTKIGTQIYGYDVYNLVLRAYEMSQRDDSYTVTIKIDGSVVPYNTNVDGVKAFLASIGLNYANLSYELVDNGGVIQQLVNEEDRNAAIANFKRMYDYKIQNGSNSGYDSLGRIYSIEISKTI